MPAPIGGNVTVAGFPGSGGATREPVGAVGVTIRGGMGIAVVEPAVGAVARPGIGGGMGIAVVGTGRGSRRAAATGREEKRGASGLLGGGGNGIA